MQGRILSTVIYCTVLYIQGTILGAAISNTQGLILGTLHNQGSILGCLILQGPITLCEALNQRPCLPLPLSKEDF
jgi:hypothetical protein